MLEIILGALIVGLVAYRSRRWLAADIITQESDIAYQEGVEEGTIDGRDEGYEDGYEDGYSKGYSAGFEDGEDS